MKTTLVILGLAAVGGYVVYQKMKERILEANFAGYQIVEKDGKFFARNIATGALSDSLPDVNTVKTWIGASKAKGMLSSVLPGMGDNLLLPPPGRTITESGQVIGGLGEHFDAYDAAPSQYRRDVVNDLGRWGSSFVQSAKNVTKAPVKTVSKGITTAGNLVSHVGSSIANLPRNVVATAVSIRSNIVNAPRHIMAGVKTGGMIVGLVKPKAVKESGGEMVYQDENGKTITKAEYDARMKVIAEKEPKKIETYKGYTLWTYKQDTGGVLYLVNYNPATGSVEAAYPTLAEVKADIDLLAKEWKMVVSKPSAVKAGPANKITYGNTGRGQSPKKKAPVVQQAPPKASIVKVALNSAGAMTKADATAAMNAYNSGGQAAPQVQVMPPPTPAAPPVQPMSTYDAAKAAADLTKAAAPAPISAPSPTPVPTASSTSISAPAPAPLTPAPAQPMSTYDAAKAAAEQASMSRASDDSGFGPTASDSGIGPAADTSFETPQEAPPMPEQIQSVQTPSAQMLPEAPPMQPEPPKKSNALLVGGGIAAAVMAALALK